jgi:hypothetical protein
MFALLLAMPRVYFQEGSAMSEKRREYVEKLKAQLDTWNVEIDKLEAQTKQTMTEMNHEFEQQWSRLQAKRKEVESRLEELRQSGEGAWEDLKVGAESAWTALGEALKSAKARFHASPPPADKQAK